MNPVFSLLSVIAVGIAVTAPAIGAPAPPANLEAAPVSNKLKLHLNEHAFSWDYDRETHWQVLVSSSEARLAVDVGDLWDSQKRQQLNNAVLYRGEALKDGATVWWKARIWRDGEVSPWSAVQQLRTPTAETPQGAIRNRIVFLGGSLIADLERHGHLETAITARWPHHDITFRNLGWPGDDVFGKARGEFGSAHNTRSWQPPGAEAGFGFQELMRQVEEAKPSTLIVGYGAETAFAAGPEEMAEFRKGYRDLVQGLSETGAHLVLLTPIRHQRHRQIVSDPAPANQRLTEAREFIVNLAAERDLAVVDLQNILFGAWYADPDANHDYANGVRLNEHGHRTLAGHLARSLGIDFSWIDGVEADWAKTRRGYRWNRTLDHLPYLGGSHRVHTPMDEELPAVTRIDGDVVSARHVKDEQYNGVRYHEDIRIGPDHDQVEALRRKIVEKNQYYRYKLRPINKAYIFLFRRHEMGHLAYEMEDFDELIAGHEAAIAHLRVPRPHSYEIEELEQWKSPRDYPDHEVPKVIPEPDIEKELESFTVAEGIEVSLFARDPMIANPINMNWDSRAGPGWPPRPLTRTSSREGLRTTESSSSRIRMTTA